MSSKYVVIAEFKAQGPIVMETELDAGSYEAARRRQRDLSARPDVIKVAIAKLVHESGNTCLLLTPEKKEEEND